MSKSDLIDIEVEILHETADAYLIHDGGVKKVWLPKSEVEIEITRPMQRIGTLTLPEWLALERGLI
jgi:hypothetical protein